jgi:hypothetical protein
MPILLTSGYVAEPAVLKGSDFPLIDKPYDVVGLSRQLRGLLDRPAKGRRGRRRKSGADHAGAPV